VVEKRALSTSSADCVRRFSTSVAPSGSGASAAAKSHFTARGKQAAIFTGPAAARRFSDGSRRADSSQRSGTASKGRSLSQRRFSTAAFTSGDTTWAYWQWQ
jgi:hypothetical protein